MKTNDTIAAICSGLGGAVAVIRISGKNALSIGNHVWKGTQALKHDNARQLRLGKCFASSIKNGDPAMAVFMPHPDSYTGEDVVEIHCHGGTLISRKTLESILKAGARPAEPGEFTYRAFMNNKMDLTQAEAVADIISAHSDMALNIAERQAAGILGRKIQKIRSGLITILSESESRLDFGEENLDWTAPGILIHKIKKNLSEVKNLLKSKTEGAILREGIRIVIAGRPNVGKSSLLNLLLGYDRAIVTTIPGTTRDTLEEFTTVRNIPVKLIDTAGIREADNIIEGKGIERSFASIKQAQIILWLLDAGADIDKECDTMERHLPHKKNAIAVWNKIDLAGKKRKLPDTKFPTVRISVEKQTAIENLLDNIEKAVWGYPHSEEPEIAVSARHVSLLEEVIDALPGAIENLLSEHWELASVHLRSAISALGAITGEDANPDILEEIFSRFCIGK